MNPPALVPPMDCTTPPMAPTPVRSCSLLALGLLPAIVVGLLVGCASQQDPGGAPPGPSTPVTSQVTGAAENHQALGARAVPGALIVAERIRAMTPGAVVRFHLVVADTVQNPQVSAFLGSDFNDPQLVVATVTPTGAGNDFTVAADLPLVMPGNLHLLLRLTFADGSVSESSNQDFAL